MSIVYALSNASMPGLLKIGRSDKSAASRIESYNRRSNTALPFVVEIEIRTFARSQEVERALHNLFSDQRISPKREFFQISLEQIEPLMRVLGEVVSTPSDMMKGEQSS